MKPTFDERYSVNKEFCGYEHKEPVKGLEQGQMYVARFCGEWIGCELTENEATLLCVFHYDERNLRLL